MIRNLAALTLVKNDCFWLPYALESIRGMFEKVVLYDIDSRDGSKDVLSYYKSVLEGDGTKVILEFFPDMEPRVQILARNAMIAEAGTNYYFLADADEVLAPGSDLDTAMFDIGGTDKLYGIINRIEVCEDLQSAYSVDKFVPHHRIYSRRAVWEGSHPGERPRIKQKPSNEMKLDKVTTYHFHNALRSPLEADVPSRLKRKSQHTYHPGVVSPIDLFERLPILKRPIHNFPVNPALAELQKQCS